MPMATESRLAPMPGPIPHSYAVRKELTLPEAFTSFATHFTPIILTREEDSGEGTPLSEAAVEGYVVFILGLYVQLIVLQLTS